MWRFPSSGFPWWVSIGSRGKIDPEGLKEKLKWKQDRWQCPALHLNAPCKIPQVSRPKHLHNRSILLLPSYRALYAPRDCYSWSSWGKWYSSHRFCNWGITQLNKLLLTCFSLSDNLGAHWFHTWLALTQGEQLGIELEDGRWYSSYWLLVADACD